MALEALMTWTFTAKTEPTQEILQVLLEGEQVYAAYKTIRDVAVVTNKRIVIADKPCDLPARGAVERSAGAMATIRVRSEHAQGAIGRVQLTHERATGAIAYIQGVNEPAADAIGLAQVANGRSMGATARVEGAKNPF